MLNPEQFKTERYGEETQRKIGEIAINLIQRNWHAENESAKFLSGWLYDRFRDVLNIEHVEDALIGLFKDICNENGWNVEITSVPATNAKQYSITPSR